MSKFFKLIAGCSLLVSTSAFAGAHMPGSIYIDTLNNAWVSGSMNVRFSNLSYDSDSYISMSKSNNGAVNIFALDFKDDQFACYIQPWSPIYQTAVDIINNLTDGTAVFAWKENAESNECTFLELVKDSRYQQ